MKFPIIFVTLMTIAAGCTNPDGFPVATVNVTHPTFQDGKADSETNTPQDAYAPETGIDAANDGSTDKADAVLCVADPAWECKVETNCRGINGDAVWKFDASTCTWSLGSLPNADPPLASGVSPLALEWTRTTVYECPPLEE